MTAVNTIHHRPDSHRRLEDRVGGAGMRQDLPSARELAHALGGKSIGRGQWMAKCPSHPERTGSLSIKEGYSGVLVHCFGGLLASRRHRRVAGSRALASLRPRTGRRGGPQEASGARPEGRSRSAGRRGQERAKAAFTRDLVRRIWREAGPCFGTLAQDYLRSRKIELDDDLTPRVLRFHPRVQFGPKAQAQFHPALLAGYTPIEGAADDDNPVALHRIALTPDAKKIGKGMALGPTGGCVIRLWPDEAVEQGLVIGEGLKPLGRGDPHRASRNFAAAGMGRGLLRHPRKLPGSERHRVPDHPRSTTTRSGTGQRAAETCAQRWKNAGRQVIRLVPYKPGSDFADIAMEATE